MSSHHGKAYLLVVYILILLLLFAVEDKQKLRFTAIAAIG
jgi:hypothetical protein